MAGEILASSLAPASSPLAPAASASEARDVRLKDVRGVQRVADAFKAA